MRNAIRLYCFWYGWLGAVGFSLWYIAAWLGDASLPENVWVVEFIFLLHSIAAIATFQRIPSGNLWQPVLAITDKRIRLGRLLIGLTSINFLVCFCLLGGAALEKDVSLQETAVYLVLSSFLLQNTIYIGVHWALRPENLFSSSLLKAISNPIGLLFPKR
jgi:hypothetical protein